MTAISTFSSFFMMPLWLFTLGEVIFNEADIAIPYANICSYGLSLVGPLFIGVLIAK
jgi:sodium/bile acid cotransporter 3/5